MKRIVTSLAVAATILAMPLAAAAHVVVRPAEVNVGAFQTFTTGVPNEKEIPVTEVRLTIPTDLNYVAPTVKPGWTINVKKEGDKVTEIDWSGGSIPAGQRDDFTFSAQAPAKSGEIQWKAYQTYSDGTTVAWDQAPGAADSEETTPYSVTKVVNDLATDTKAASTTTTKTTSNNVAYAALGVSVVAALLGLAAVAKRK